MRDSPAQKYAKNYVMNVQRPLTENDIVHVFNCGMKYGRVSAWNKVFETMPIRCHPDEQVVVLVEGVHRSYSFVIVTAAEYPSFVGNRINPGIPIYWAYLRTLLPKGVKLPELPPLPKQEKENLK